MTALLGLLGGVCFAYCGVPTAWRTLRAGRSVGTPVSVAWMILLGCVLMFAYLTLAHGFDPVLAVNHGVEVSSWAVVVWFHYRPSTAAGRAARAAAWQRFCDLLARGER